MSGAVDGADLRPEVVAIVVSHDGARWLPRLLRALEESVVAPDLVLGVDAGSGDDSARLLTLSFGPERVLRLPRRTSFGDAVAAALDWLGEGTTTGRHASGRVPGQWVWLLHDDCVPAPDALERLLRTARSDDDIAVVGPRTRDVSDPPVLLEVGITMSGTGARETGVEPGERDQGQYPSRRDVLAVGTAGMLVRRDRWQELGGLDAALPPICQDADFGWRTNRAGYRVVAESRAVVSHAAASRRGLRSASPPPSRREMRAGGIATVLANCRLGALPVLYLRFLIAGVVRVCGLLLAKLPSQAWGEATGAVSVLAQPWAIARARRWRRLRRNGRAATGVRPLLPSWWSPYARGIDLLRSRLEERWQRTAGSAVGDGALRRRLRAVARHPLTGVTAVLLLASMVATRGLWGTGFLEGGGLLPAPDGAGAWWDLGRQTHHEVGVPSDQVAAPYVVLLAIPSLLVVGHARLLIDVVMLLTVPIAGVGAWFASRHLCESYSVRVWIAVSYGLLPVACGLVTSGHLGTTVVAITLPWIVSPAVAMVRVSDEVPFRAACACGLVLSVAAAFAPMVWVVATAVGLVAISWSLLRMRFGAAFGWLLALVLPVALLAPWSDRFFTHPGLFGAEAGGLSAPIASNLPAWQLVFARIGAAGQAPWWCGAGLTLAALLALTRRDTRPRVTAAWVVVAAALAVAAFMWRGHVDLPLGAGEAQVWLGVPLLVATAAAIAAVGIAVDGIRGAPAGSGFGSWRPIGVVVALAAVSTPVLVLGWWVATAPHGDLRRGSAVALPAYMRVAMDSAGAQVLVLTPDARAIRYQVLGGDGLRIGDESVLPGSSDPRLTTLVGDLVAGGPLDAGRLAARGIAYVALAPGVPREEAHVRSALDTQPALLRTSTDRAALSGWQVTSTRLPVPGNAAGSRTGALVAQGIGWLVVVVLAVPGGRRKVPADSGGES